MDNTQHDDVRSTADRVLEMAEEIEAGGDARFGGEGLERARAILHEWIDAMTGVVVTAALGRVTIIHDGGLVSTIASPDLPFTMSTSVAAKPKAWDEAGKP